jgi:hypothetical protein
MFPLRPARTAGCDGAYKPCHPKPSTRRRGSALSSSKIAAAYRRDIIVADGGSSDATQAVACAAGARIIDAGYSHACALGDEAAHPASSVIASSTAERDFIGWRDQSLTICESYYLAIFGLGRNHRRARDRLIALSTYLAGDIPDVKERQFRIGYEIERFEGLIIAYRSSDDDMPVLNPAVLEDLDRLRIVLVMGINKLERWSEFRRAAAEDPLQEGGASPDVVGAAIDDMAAEMEAEPKYFDPELPRFFRFLAEAAKDPMGATKTIVFGTVKSAENVVVSSDNGHWASVRTQPARSNSISRKLSRPR